MSWESLFKSLDTHQDLVVLTANQGLARTLLLAYGASQKAQGQRVWQQPQLMAYQNYFQKWLMQSYEGRTRLLLTKEQCELIWRDIIESSEPDILLDAAQTAQQARQAESLWQDYLLSNDKVADWASLETLRFMKWRKLFWTHMEEQSWWPPEYALVAAVHAIEKRRDLSFKQVVLIGFEELTPLQQRWVSALQGRGIDVSFFSPSKESSPPQVWRMPTFDDELNAAARWAQSTLEAQPHWRLGIVMPGLEVFLPQVKHRLGRILAPESTLGDAPDKAQPFHISLGRPMMQWRPVKHLFLFWHLLNTPRDFEDIEMIFRSTFLWGTASLMARQRFLGALNKKRYSRIGVYDVRRTLTKETSSHPDELQTQSVWTQTFMEVTDAHKAKPAKAFPSYWSEYLTEVAEKVMWLKGKGLGSVLFQLKAAVKEALEQSAKLDIILGEIALGTFLSHLKRLWQNQPFQPESQNEPIRVLGILEAMGNEFDAVWVCRMNEGIWPPQGHPNPFIPARVQQENQMPHASVQRELHFSQIALNWLLKSAPEVNLSFAEQDGNLTLEHSPLLTPWLDGVSALPSEPHQWWQEIQEQVRPAYFQDWQGVPYTDEVVKGGASLFEYQVQCPFKAYALKRLFVQAPEDAEPAVGADQHGELLHATLYEIWGTLKEQSALLKLSKEQKLNLISGAIDLAWDKMKAKLINTSQLFEASEKARILHHVDLWLQREEERPPFKVLEREKKYEVALEGKKLNLKLDRVDALCSGATFCLDYKTSKRITALELTQEPLEKVQLPLYALAMSPPPHVLAYGVINAEKKQLVGIGDEAHLDEVALDNLKKRKKKPELSWDEQLEAWRLTLSATLTAFLQGKADRTPLRDNVCLYCDARPVCRIGETLHPAGGGR
jgi:ATP-dependent helicase/nuclease subunit B